MDDAAPPSTPPPGTSSTIARVEIDRELCIGAASCVTIAPEAFQLDDENKATPQPNWRHLSQEQLIEAAKSCPVLAIYLYDQTGQRLYPE